MTRWKAIKLLCNDKDGNFWLLKCRGMDEENKDKIKIWAIPKRKAITKKSGKNYTTEYEDVQEPLFVQRARENT